MPAQHQANMFPRSFPKIALAGSLLFIIILSFRYLSYVPSPQTVHNGVGTGDGDIGLGGMKGGANDVSALLPDEGKEETPVGGGNSLIPTTALDPDKLSYTEAECNHHFPGLFAEIDKAVARGPIEYPKEKVNQKGFITGRIYDGGVSALSMGVK